MRADTDTFDTWFSSGQWPFASLTHPDSKDYKTYYPTNVMETGGDLIFFWISRMIMLGLYVTGELPFKQVYMHGLVLDAKGNKMSKSKGNVINPLDLTTKYGTDAFRIGLIVGNTPGTSLPLSEDKIRAYKNFANKVWNITRFVLTGIESFDLNSTPAITETDKKHLDTLQETIKDITTDMDSYRFYMASEKIYHYIWHTFADIIIEESKAALNGSDENAKKSKQFMLYEILKTSLKVLHPFMPFVTEEIWSDLPHQNKNLLIIETWPA